MRHAFRATKVVIALGVVLAFSLLATAQPASASVTDRGYMVHLTNADRERHDVDDLKIDRLLCEYAERHSREMASAGSLFHSTDDQLRAALGSRRWVIAGENVGVGTDLPALERAFMASPPHRENVLRTTYVHAAVGVVTRGNRVWVTVIFWG